MKRWRLFGRDKFFQMLTGTKTLRLTEGATGVSFHGLVRKKILGVWREGMDYDIILGLIGSPLLRQCQFLPAFGIFKFAVPGNPGGENVFIWYNL